MIMGEGPRKVSSQNPTPRVDGPGPKPEGNKVQRLVISSRDSFNFS